MSNVTKRFIDYIYRLSLEDLNNADEEQIKKCFLDYLAVAYGGSAVNYNLVDLYIKENVGKYTALGYKKKIDFNSAILLNAANSHVLELDDGHRYAMMHLGSPIFSGLLTVAEKEKASVYSMLKGAVVGYEAAIRLAKAFQPNHKKQGFHGTGTCGAIGCALAIASMLGYSRDEFENVLSAAATSAAGLLEVITGESMQKIYNVSNAAITGVNAALFGKIFQGPEDILGGERGFFKCFSSEFDVSKLFADNANKEIHGIYLKPYAACRHCHAPIEAAVDIYNSRQIDIQNIEAVEVYTYDLAVYGHDHTKVNSVSSAKMSTPYSVAMALISGKGDLSVYNEVEIRSEELNGLIDKVRVISDDDLSKLVPKKRAAVVKVLLSNGECIERRVDYPKGEPENPIHIEEVKEKLLSMVTFAGKKEEICYNIFKLLEHLDVANIQDLFEVMED